MFSFSVGHERSQWHIVEVGSSEWDRQPIEGINHSGDRAASDLQIRDAEVSSVRSLCCGFSFAPSGLAYLPPTTHGLRRGLHSVAASRL